MATTDDLLADRYGRRERWPGRRAVPAAVVVALLVAGVALAGWVAWLRGSRTAEWRDLGVVASSVTDSSVSLTFQVIVPPGTAAVCTLYAVNARLADVGRAEVEIPPSADGRTTRTVTLRTTERADGAAVRTCIRR